MANEPFPVDIGVGGLTGAQWTEVLAILDAVMPGATVRVFGSRATGRARPFSDLDLLVVEPRQLGWQARADLSDRFESSHLPFRVDVVEAEALSAATAKRTLGESCRCLGAKAAATPTG